MHTSTRKQLPSPSPTALYKNNSPIAGSQGRKKYPSYRRNHNIGSPTTIALKKRSTTLPTSFSSPSLSDMIQPDFNTLGDDDLEIKKTRSEDIFSRSRQTSAHTYDCNYKHALENVYENFGIERKLVVLKPSQVKNNSNMMHRPRGRTSTYPGMLHPKQEAKKSIYVPTTRVSSGPVDVDEVSVNPSLHYDEKHWAQRRKTKDSAPTETKLSQLSLERLDAEQLLSQLGMDVKEEDYCLEGEFTTTTRPSRCHSYDCNYSHPLESVYEDFGIERKLVELKRPDEMHDKKKRTRVRSMKKMVGRSLGNIGYTNLADEKDSNRKHHHDQHVHGGKSSNNMVLKTKVLSVLRGNRHNRKDKVPEQIIATITPTASEDDAVDHCPISPEDMRLLYRWQTARVRSANNGGVEAPVARRTAAASAMSSGNKMNYEDVLSIASCGEKTALMDNRRQRRHRQGFSF